MIVPGKVELVLLLSASVVAGVSSSPLTDQLSDYVIDLGSVAAAVTAIAAVVWGIAKIVVSQLRSVISDHTDPLVERIDRIEDRQKLIASLLESEKKVCCGDCPRS